MTQQSPEDVGAMVRAVYAGDFRAFAIKVFAELHGGLTEFVDGWYIDAMCQALEDVKSGRDKRLVITVPPRHLKSITVAVAFTAFLLGHNPRVKIISASYGLDLARKHGADCRRVMESAWYRATFPATRLASRRNTQDEISTTAGGGRKAVSIGGAVTGHGCDVLVIDDLLKASDAQSETELCRAQEFMDASLLSRFDNPSEGRVICIQQRLHEVDPAGHLLSKGIYRHLNLPAIAEIEERVPLTRGRVHLRRPGDVLSPARLPPEKLDEMRKEMGTATFNCQYQQNPIATDGSVLRWEWFGTYDSQLERHQYELVVQSWDTGMSADARSDYSVCTTWGYYRRQWWLLDVLRDRLDYPDLKKNVLTLGHTWSADAVLIEKAATGIPILQECLPANRRRFRAITPVQDKEVRFNASCSPVEAGEVLLPKDAPWLAEFRRELQSFPRGRYDDQVDSFSQLLNWSKGTGFWRALPREHPTRIARRERPRLRG
ncbi:hypothetical protein EF888_14640 [Silicimonas algicola]|uniref:Putative phage terminase large subunit-like protein n=1 Tax=Silicimonas algicola TaxID=1826607 RepID=A0A316G488_9RHOB|nr:phage terminase large subunit [Silicimonas algicola]AZQ68264.1 hypothetical protein EF888_14640 [Silicimonas algicola]PWK54600.1 putative phage terminase large subunit-like protein [Silicimonas algicola]